MKINLIAIGTKMPQWVNTAFDEYTNRLPKDFSINLVEIAAQKRTKSADLKKIINIESQALLEAVPSNNKIIAFDRTGKALNTETLSQQLNQHYQNSDALSLLVGGPEGISQAVLAQCEKWSLSQLTLPHPLVRIIVAEQIFRAWAILNNHPYHR